MKTFKAFTLAVIILFTGIVSCVKRDDTLPTAKFSYTTTRSLPATAHFVNLSVVPAPGTTFAWNFGDGATSTATDPTHAYIAAGTYQVSLTQTPPGGTPETVTQNLVISTTGPSGSTGRPQAPQFNYSITYGVPYFVTFTNTSTEADLYLWDFGDNSTSNSSSSTVTHTYNSSGPYYVVLTAINSNGTDTTGLEIRF